MKNNPEFYLDLIKKIISEDKPYLFIDKDIKFDLKENEDVHVFAKIDSKENLHVNPLAIDRALDEDMPDNIEYYLLHIIRHIYQRQEIKKANKGLKTNEDIETINIWEKENENFLTAKHQSGKIDMFYFYQENELDAFAFSHAVMAHKYKDKDLSKLYMPLFDHNLLDEAYEKFEKIFENI